MMTTTATGTTTTATGGSDNSCAATPPRVRPKWGPLDTFLEQMWMVASFTVRAHLLPDWFMLCCKHLRRRHILLQYCWDQTKSQYVHVTDGSGFVASVKQIPGAINVKKEQEELRMLHGRDALNGAVMEILLLLDSCNVQGPHALIIAGSHVTMDGTSLSIILKDMSDMLAMYSGDPPTLPLNIDAVLPCIRLPDLTVLNTIPFTKPTLSPAIFMVPEMEARLEASVKVNCNIPPELGQQILSRYKREKTSLASTICAAFCQALIALYPPSSALPLRIRCPVGLRGQWNIPQESLGSLVSDMIFEIPVAPLSTSSFWDQARSLSQTIRNRITTNSHLFSMMNPIPVPCTFIINRMPDLVTPRIQVESHDMRALMPGSVSPQMFVPMVMVLCLGTNRLHIDVCYNQPKCTQSLAVALVSTLQKCCAE